jgi:aryl-alcohol dehydrogenase-like predicted oxidoreductase
VTSIQDPAVAGIACLRRDALEYAQLGRTGLLVSRIVLGAWNFGKVTAEADCGAILDAALEAGVNMVDTADKYGHGASEEIVGRWLAGGAGRREKVVLATKVYGAFADWPNEGGLSARHIRRAVEDSLRRLGTDHIDLYQLHHVDRRTPWEEVWQALEVLIAHGKVIYVGSSNHAGWQLAQGQEGALRRGGLGLASEQCLYNLAERTAEQEVLPAARAYGVGTLVWSPLHGGILGGALGQYAGTGVRRLKGRGGRWLAQQRNRDQIEAFERLCMRHGHPPAEVALAWLLTRPDVTAPVVGPRTLEQFHSCLAATALTLDSQILHELEEIFPGPGPSPESFAW